MPAAEPTPSQAPADATHHNGAIHNEEEIARLAYHFYLQRGRTDGRPEEDWYRAEQYFRNLRNGDSSITRSGA